MVFILLFTISWYWQSTVMTFLIMLVILLSRKEAIGTSFDLSSLVLRCSLLLLNRRLRETAWKDSVTMDTCILCKVTVRSDVYLLEMFLLGGFLTELCLYICKSTWKNIPVLELLLYYLQNGKERNKKILQIITYITACIGMFCYVKTYLLCKPDLS